MSDAGVPRRFPIIAMGFAVVAMVFAIAAVIVVLRRGEGPEAAAAGSAGSAAARPAIPALSDRKVLATDVVKLQGNLESVVENGETIGVRVADEGLAGALGLERGDVIAALSGRRLAHDSDLHDAVFNASMMSATTLYVEVRRDSRATLIRWQLDGDLRQARYGSRGLGSLGSLGGYGGAGGLGGLGTYTPPAPDPLLDTIERIDDTHVKIPRSTVDQLLADPTKMLKGARVVPAMKNGKPEGFKLYAIRPPSIYARLGFTNGDTLRSANGLPLDTPDQALEAYSKLQKASELELEITRRGKPLTISIQITK